MNLNLCNDLERLKCHSCQNFLSYFPISELNGHFICGRCPVDDSKNAKRIDPYEALAEVHRFNCRYRKLGCLKLLFPKDVSSHEELCSFSPAKCLLSTCTWEGKFKTFLKHCGTAHSQEILEEKQEFSMDLTSSNEIEEICLKDETAFLILIKFDLTHKTLECLVSQHERDFDKKKYFWQLKARKNNCPNRKTVIETNVLKCCSDLLGTDSLDEKIFFSVKSVPNPTPISKRNAANTFFMSSPRCSNCSKEIFPPIYSNNIGLLFCGSCIHEDTSSSCAMNLAVSQMAQMAEYSCPNDGCSFLGLISSILKHREDCEFQIIDCILSGNDSGCKWKKQRKELINHIQDKHLSKNNFGKVCCPITFPESGCETNYVLYKYEDIFFVFVLTVYKENYISCSVEAINSVDDGFRYEIEILDTTTRGDRLVAGKDCTVFTSFDSEERKSISETEHRSSKSYCNFRLEQFQCYFAELNGKSALNFRIQIFRK